AFAAPSMHHFTRRRRADPSRIAAGSRNPAVHRHRKLEYPHRPPVGDPGDEPFVQTLRFVFEHSSRDLDLRALQDCDSAASDARIGIHASDDDALDAGRGQRVGAWRGLSEMRARLERYVCSRAASERARIGKRLRFTVRTPSPARDAAADDFPAAHDYASYRRIWSGQAQAVARERERLAHEALVPHRGVIENPPPD